MHGKIDRDAEFFLENKHGGKIASWALRSIEKYREFLRDETSRNTPVARLEG